MSGQLWETCLDRLEREYPGEVMDTYIRSLRLRAENDQYLLIAPNPLMRDIVRRDYLERIRDVFEDQGEPREAVRVVIARPRGASAPKDRSNGFHTGLDPRFSFEAFVQGESNQMACAMARQAAEAPGAVNPLFIYGSTGLGKTHLMQAAGNLVRQRHPDFRVLYVPSERFVEDVVSALNQGNMAGFKQAYRQVDMLLIDDVQFLAGKDASATEFFHTFNHLSRDNKQIILTCDRFPKELDRIDPRLRSRFAWGMTVSIEPPDFETRAVILMKKAAQRGVELDREVAYLIARRIRSHVRDLEGALTTLIANANLKGETITVEFARECLRDLLTAYARAITVENIQRQVAEYYRLRVTDLMSARRTRSVARPRMLAMAMTRELTDLSLPEIGRAFSRDHTTVLNACRKIENLCETDPRLRQDRAKLRGELTS